jgi:hypothetical protein
MLHERVPGINDLSTQIIEFSLPAGSSVFPIRCEIFSFSLMDSRGCNPGLRGGVFCDSVSLLLYFSKIASKAVPKADGRGDGSFLAG